MPRFTYYDQQNLQSFGPIQYWLDFSEDQLYNQPTMSGPAYTSAVHVLTKGWKNKVFRAVTGTSGTDGSSTVAFNTTFTGFNSVSTESSSYYTPGVGISTTPLMGVISEPADLLKWTYNAIVMARESNELDGKIWLFSGRYLNATSSGKFNGQPQDAGTYSGTFLEGSAGAYITRNAGDYQVVLTDSWYNQAFRGSTGRDNAIKFKTFTSPNHYFTISLRSRVVQIDPIAMSLSNPSTVIQEIDLYVNGLLKETLTLTYANCTYSQGLTTTALTAVNNEGANAFVNQAATNPFTYAGYYNYSFGAGRNSSGVAVQGFGAIGEIITYGTDIASTALTADIPEYFRNRWHVKTQAAFGVPSAVVGTSGAPFSFQMNISNADGLFAESVGSEFFELTVVDDSIDPTLKTLTFDAPTYQGRVKFRLSAADAIGNYAGETTFDLWFTSTGTLDPISDILKRTGVSLWFDPSDLTAVDNSLGHVTNMLDKASGLPWEVISPFSLTTDPTTFLSRGVKFAQSVQGVSQPTRIELETGVDRSPFYKKVDGLFVVDYKGVDTQSGSGRSIMLFVGRHSKGTVYNQQASLFATARAQLTGLDVTANGGIGFESPASTPEVTPSFRLIASNNTETEQAGYYAPGVGYDQNSLYTFSVSGLASGLRVNKTPMTLTPYVPTTDTVLLRLVFSSTSTYSPPYETYDTTDSITKFSAIPTEYAYTQRTTGKFSPIAWKARPSTPPLTGTSTKLILGNDPFYWQFWANPSAYFDHFGATAPYVETVCEMTDGYADAVSSVLRVSFENIGENDYRFVLSVGQNSSALQSAQHPTVFNRLSNTGYKFFNIYRYVVAGVSYFNLAVNGVIGTPIQASVNLTSSRMSLGASYGYHTHGSIQGAYSDSRLVLGTLEDYTQVPTAVFPTAPAAKLRQPMPNVAALYSSQGYVPGPFGELILVPDGTLSADVIELERLLYEKWIAAPSAGLTISQPSIVSVDIGRRYTATVSIGNGTSSQVTASIVAEEGWNWTIESATQNGQGIWTITGSMPLDPTTFNIDITANCDGDTTVKTVALTATNRTLPVIGSLSPSFAKRSTDTTPTVLQSTAPVTLGVYDYTTNLNASFENSPAKNWTVVKNGTNLNVQGQMPKSLSAFELRIDIE